MQSPPQSDPPLKSPQLPILVFAGFFTLEGLEKGFIGKLLSGFYQISTFE
jgi:hypothetical protein